MIAREPFNNTFPLKAWTLTSVRIPWRSSADVLDEHASRTLRANGVGRQQPEPFVNGGQGRIHKLGRNTLLGGTGYTGRCLDAEYGNDNKADAMKGRKCCSGCNFCPRWGTGDVLRVLGANHKVTALPLPHLHLNRVRSRHPARTCDSKT